MFRLTSRAIRPEHDECSAENAGRVCQADNISTGTWDTTANVSNYKNRMNGKTITYIPPALAMSVSITSFLSSSRHLHIVGCE
jgi:hypothetical protein